MDLAGRGDLRMQLQRETNWRTLPMIFLNKRFVGGYVELRNLASAGLVGTASHPVL